MWGLGFRPRVQLQGCKVLDKGLGDWRLRVRGFGTNYMSRTFPGG